ncbi:MAG: hypothetical protein U9Q33_02245 [Campylobacterota bacterium]|nr:hypothetical protein [Campylobacterota bacterium]
MLNKSEEKKVIVIDDHCEQRIKPNLIRDVKTEAVLVFARTALERFFAKLDKDDKQPQLSNEEDSQYIYSTLRELLKDLQKHVVNVEYLIELVQNTKKHPYSQELKQLAKYEEPLIVYYDTMAKRMEYHFPSKTAAIPEFIVVCILSIWFLEEEKDTAIYPFVSNYDFLKMIEKFEIYGKGRTDEKKQLIILMQKVSLDVTESLKKVKYKFNKDRVSKKRKKR